MNHWAFITAAYAVTVLGTGGLAVWAWRAMRSAEAAAESLRRDK
jgi:hypothetical protein